jgi:hypothetical protein
MTTHIEFSCHGSNLQALNMRRRKTWRLQVNESLFGPYRSLMLVQAMRELREALGEDTISTDDEDLHRHGYSEWSSINIDQLPVAVAYPKSTEEVSQIAKVCYKYKIPMSMFAKVYVEVDTYQV